MRADPSSAGDDASGVASASVDVVSREGMRAGPNSEGDDASGVVSASMDVADRASVAGACKV